MNNAQSQASLSGHPRGLTATWLLLVGFSLLNFYLAEGKLGGKVLVFVVLFASFFKLALVAGSFMELWGRGRPYFYLALLLFALTLGVMAIAW